MTSFNNVELVYFNRQTHSEKNIDDITYIASEDDNVKLFRSTTGNSYRSTPIVTKMKSMLGIVDDKGRILLMPSCVHKIAEHDFEESVVKLAAEQDSHISKNERSMILINSFGSAKQKRILQAKLANQINDESLDVAVSCAQEAVDTSTIEVFNHSQSEKDTWLELLPKCNIEAKRPEDVFSLSDIIRDEEIHMLLDEATVLQSMTKQQIENVCKLSTWSYYCEHLTRRPTHDNKACLRYCSLLTFQKFLMQLHQAGVRMLNRKVPFLVDAPSKIRERLFAEFVSSSSDNPNDRFQKKITARSKERLLNQILILALFIDNFCINLSYFMKDLKLTKTKISYAVQSIGCQLKTVLDNKRGKNSTQQAVLRTPVKFPTLNVKRRN